MSSYAIRRGRLDDLEDLFRLILELAEHEFVENPTITQEIIREDAFGVYPCLLFYVAEFSNSEPGGKGKVVAFASVNSKNHNICRGRTSFLNGLFTDEAHRGKGLGKALMKAVAKDCITSGQVSLDFDVKRTHARTRKFYSAIGVTNNTETKDFEYWRFEAANMKKFVSGKESGPGGVSIRFELDDERE